MSNVKVIQLGLGKVVSNYGTHNGVPAVFIEPVLGEPGELGAELKGDREPQIKNDSVSDGGIIIEIHDQRGLDVLLDDFYLATRQDRCDYPNCTKLWDYKIQGMNLCPEHYDEYVSECGKDEN